MMRRIDIGGQYAIAPGDHFTLLLPDGLILAVSQTQDDFSIERPDGTVAYANPTSKTAKHDDSAMAQTTGRG